MENIQNNEIKGELAAIKRYNTETENVSALSKVV